MDASIHFITLFLYFLYYFFILMSSQPSIRSVGWPSGLLLVLQISENHNASKTFCLNKKMSTRLNIKFNTREYIIDYENIIVMFQPNIKHICIYANININIFAQKCHAFSACLHFVVWRVVDLFGFFMFA